MADVSHGRGGAGNINPDDTQYVDGEIVRVGPEGSHGDGAFSSGRGGAANIADSKDVPKERTDKELVPEMAVRPSTDTDHHVGRGGAGNEVKVDPKAIDHDKQAALKHKMEHGAPVRGLADKLKDMIMGKKK